MCETALGVGLYGLVVSIQAESDERGTYRIQSHGIHGGGGHVAVRERSRPSCESDHQPQPRTRRLADPCWLVVAHLLRWRDDGRY